MPIPDIQIEVNINELQQAIEGSKCFDHHVPSNRNVKAGRSTLFKVISKITRKEISKRGVKKPFKLKLDYDEAHHLEEFLRMSNAIAPNHYHRTFADKLHQKLA